MCLICWFTASLIGCIGHNYSLSGKPTLLPKHDKRHKSIEFVSIILTLYKKLNLKNLKNPDIDALTFYWITFLITHTSFILLESTLVSLYGKSTSLYTGGDVIWCHQILTLIFSFIIFLFDSSNTIEIVLLTKFNYHKQIGKCIRNKNDTKWAIYFQIYDKNILNNIILIMQPNWIFRTIIYETGHEM